jgi:hypothetical protein
MVWRDDSRSLFYFLGGCCPPLAHVEYVITHWTEASLFAPRLHRRWDHLSSSSIPFHSARSLELSVDLSSSTTASFCLL